MLCVHTDTFVVQVIEDDCRAVVDEVHEDARPQRASDVEHVAQQNAEEHARQKAVELEMDEREDGRREDDGDVRVHLARQRLLQHASKSQFFANGRYQRDNEQIEEQSA